MATYDAKIVYSKGWIDEGAPEVEDFEIVDSKVESKSLGEDQIIVQVKYMSVDPYLRFGLKSSGNESSGRKVMEGFVSGIVLESNNEKFIAGDFFGGNLPFSTYQIVGKDACKNLWKLTGFVDEKNLSYGVGVLGMPGSTAYAGLCGILRPEEGGTTIFVSAASGAVGSIAGQIAKNVYNLKTIGSVGGPEKAELIKKYGYDYQIDYKEISNQKLLTAELKKADPEGIDMYFENVGSYFFDSAFESLKPNGRIAICGQIANYNNKNGGSNNINLMNTIYNSQRIEGFVCHAWLSHKKGNFLKDMSDWIKEGKVNAIDETFYEGVEQWPVAFRSLFVGSKANKGKVVVRI